MKIAIVAHYFGFGDGQGRVNYEIAKKILSDGHDLTVLAHDCSEELTKHRNMTFISIKKSVIPTQLMRNLSFARRSAKWLKKYGDKFDLIQANGFVTFAPVDVVAVHFVHGAWQLSRYFQLKNRWNFYGLYQRAYTKVHAILEKTAFTQATHVVAISPRIAEEIESLGIAREKITTILNGIDVHEFSPGIGNRGSFGLPEGVTLFLFSGDIRTHRKNLDGVLRAIASVEGVHLAVGGGTVGSPYPALAEELGIAQRVHFLGEIKNMNELMVATDGFIFPSRYDPFGLVVLEAMASGLPVITARTTGAAALLSDPEWTVDDPEDVRSLARMVRALTEDSTLRSKLGQQNRAKALDHSWDRMSSEYLNLYREVSASKSVTLEGTTVLEQTLNR
jgi:glycosyltransferase involved in cell wall biosynthesis